MQAPWFVFITLLAMCVVVGIAFLAPQVPYEEVVQEDGSTERIIKSHGYQHEKYPTMKQGGAGAERHAVTLWIGWVFATICILFFAGCLAMGMTRYGSLGPAKVPLILGTVGLTAIFSALILSYYGYMREETHTLFLSFPKPTAWMLYAIWPFPIYFMVIYYRLFDSWHFTEEDQRRLDELVANRRQATSEEH